MLLEVSTYQKWVSTSGKTGMWVYKNYHTCSLYQLLVILRKKIMSRNTSISIGNYFDDFIQSSISAGRYKNASEVVRAGLRLLEEEENRIIALRTAIHEGMESGIAYDFNPESHLDNLKAKRSING
jgi:antitoxin ParD1/3/4